MESKGWSDQESDDDEPKAERRPPVLPLGTIYQREVAPPPEPVEREHERSEPEVAQSILPGIPELSLTAPQEEQAQLPTVEEQYHLQQQTSEAVAATDEEDDEESDDEPRQTASRPITPPIPLAVEGQQPQAASAPEEVAEAEQPVVPEEPVQAEAYAPAQVGVAETPVETPVVTTPTEHVAFDPPYHPPQPTERPMITTQPTTEQQAYVPASGGAGNQPPLPPEGQAANYPQPGEHWPDEGMRYAMATPGASFNTYHNSYAQQQYGESTVTRREFDRAQEDNRRKAVATLITALALGWYLGHKRVKPLREQVHTLQQQNTAQGEQLATLQSQHHTAEQSIARQNEQLQQYSYEQPRQPASTPQPRFETVAGVPTTTAGAELPRRPVQPVPSAPSQQERVPHIIGGDGQEIVLQEGQHYERSAGGYGMVLNERNEVVQDAFEYGESFQQDRLPERMPTPFGTQDARFKHGSGAATTFASGGGGAGGVPQATLSSGQVPADHTLSAGQAAGHSTSEEAQYLLEAPQKSAVVSAITSPWLWLGVGVLMIAFFAAATI